MDPDPGPAFSSRIPCVDSFSTQGLLFLISMGALPLACGGGGGESETDTNSGTTSETAGTTTSGATTDGATTTEATGGGTTAVESSTTMEPTTGGESSVCADYAKAGVACDPMSPYSDFFDYCTESISEYALYSQACQAAGEAFFKCKTKVDCGASPQCAAELMASAIACSPPAGEVCTSWGVKYTECYMKPADQASYIGLFCQRAIWKGTNKHGPACGMAIEDHYACIAALDCVNWDSQAGCEATSDKVKKECPL